MIRKTVYVPFWVAALFIMFWALVMVSMQSATEVNYREPSDKWCELANRYKTLSIDYPCNWSGEVSRRLPTERDRDQVIILDIQPFVAHRWDPRITVEQGMIGDMSLKQVMSWSNRSLQDEHLLTDDAGNRIYEEVYVKSDTIGGHPVLRRRMILHFEPPVIIEDVYVARPDDAIVIRLRTDEETLEEVLPVFDRVVQSFGPLP